MVVEAAAQSSLQHRTREAAIPYGRVGWLASARHIYATGQQGGSNNPDIPDTLAAQWKPLCDDHSLRLARFDEHVPHTGRGPTSTGGGNQASALRARRPTSAHRRCASSRFPGGSVEIYWKTNGGLLQQGLCSS